MADTNLTRMMETVLANIKNAADVNTIIGEPMKVGGNTVIPVSRVSMGFTGGGIDYTSKHSPQKDSNFGGGAGAGLTVTPIAFLVVSGDDVVSLLSVEHPAPGGEVIGTIANIVDRAPGIIEKISKMFKKGRKDKEDKE